MMSAAPRTPPEAAGHTPPAPIDDASPRGSAGPEGYIESPVFFSEVLKAFERAVRRAVATGDGEARTASVPRAGGG